MTVTAKLVAFQKCETRRIRDWWVGILTEAGVPHSVKEKKVIVSSEPNEEGMAFETTHYFIDVPAEAARRLRAAKQQHQTTSRPGSNEEQDEVLARLRPLFLAAARC